MPAQGFERVIVAHEDSGEGAGMHGPLIHSVDSKI